MSYITFTNLTKSYSEDVIIDHLSFSIEKGETLCIVGPSGAGKSTLLRGIAGLEDFSSGNVFLEDKDITRFSAKQRPFVLMFQQPLLFPHMTVFENTIYGLKFTALSKKEIAQKGKEFLERIGLLSYRQAFPHELSGGQQQRVSLARALITQPQLLLLDEPFSHLDQTLRKEMRYWVKEMLREHRTTAIFITHDIDEAMEIGDRIALFENKKIQQMGKPEDLYEYPKNLLVAKFLSEGLIIEGTKFIHANHLAVQGDPTNLIKYWKAFVQSVSFKFGKKVFFLDIPQLNQQISLQIDDDLQLFEEISIGVTDLSHIVTFGEE
ncbi:ABC transporter ATP-binding protein [Salipaludibacillus neizhouensis]|uniref:Carnitine transport ATP-binding protein OpuCA n=1 Tax=Salipaludibacillus neizhouensis TaxID=885475 RepID=A0A3A9K8D1_9BACI|nr:ABC transporter ATP-binding protein [Salipaludibacillus neizhouensis]RKL69254.1 ABC transporter ATP-binding protein [Salipaludibacillus neizhouensis]